MHVTGWAIENLPPGELRDFFADPEVFNAALFGAAFTDSGYFPQSGDLSRRSRAYSEHTHWEPFIEDFVEWIRENDPPPWDDLESRKRVAFLIGAASHGLQDEIFDSLFLFQVDEKDGAGQGEADPATDGFLALDANLRFVPEPWIPMDTLVELYQVLDQGVDARTIRDSVDVMVLLYVRQGGWLTAEGLGNQYSEAIPWTRAHYLDPNIPGSLRAEINPTGAHIQALWERLHGRLDPDEVVVATYPDLPRRLISHETGTPDSWVTLVFGAGVRLDSVATTWSGGAGPVPHRHLGTRWGAEFPRLVRLEAEQALEPGGWYTAGIGAGAELIDGRTTSSAFEFEFQVDCTEQEGDCEPVEVTPPAIDGSGPVLPPDAGSTDAGDVTDAADGSDTGSDAAGEDSARRSGRGCSAAAGPLGSGTALLLLALAQASIRTGRRRRPQVPG